MTLADRKPLAFEALVALACAALNLGKPVHIDDTATLLVARAIAAAPLHAMSQLAFWDQATPRPIFELNQPHLYFALLAPFARSAHVVLFGHALVALIAWSAIVAFHRLARRLAPSHAAAATALTFLGPGFLPSQNLMNEVPLLAAWLWFLWCLLPTRVAAATDGDGADRWAPPTVRALAAAATFAGIACLVKYSALVLLPLLAWEIVRARRLRDAWVLAIPAAMLGLWSALNVYDYGRPHLLGRKVEVAHASLASTFGDAVGRAVLWPLAFGACVPFAWVYIRPLWKRRTGRIAAIVIVGFGVGMPLVQAWIASITGGAMRADPWNVAIMRGAFLIVGALGFAAASPLLGARGPIDATLRLHIVVASAFLVLVAPFVAVRHTLLVFPQVMLLLARSDVWPTGRAMRWALATTMMLGVWVAAADIRNAATYRDAVARWSAPIAPKGDHREPSTWYVGHWGFQWYAEASGWKPYLPGAGAPMRGDRVIVAESIHQVPIAARDRERFHEVATDRIAPSALDSLRTMWRGGGFYASYAIPPFVFTRAPMETFHVYEVVR